MISTPRNHPIFQYPYINQIIQVFPSSVFRIILTAGHNAGKRQHHEDRAGRETLIIYILLAPFGNMQESFRHYSTTTFLTVETADPWICNM